MASPKLRAGRSSLSLYPASPTWGEGSQCLRRREFRLGDRSGVPFGMEHSAGVSSGSHDNRDMSGQRRECLGLVRVCSHLG